MAKVIFSPLVSSVSGRLGPVVFQGGPGGAMARATASPSRRRSSAQAEARRDLATASALWMELDATTRTLWASIGRAYDPASAGPGLAFALGRRAFIRYAVQFVHFGLEVPTAPTRWPFYDYGRWILAWDPDSGGNFWLYYGPSGADAQLRIWLQEAPNWPRYSPRAPWRKAYDTATDPAPFFDGTLWALPPGPFAPFARYGVSSFWRARVSGILSDGRVFWLDWGEAYLTFP